MSQPKIGGRGDREEEPDRSQEQSNEDNSPYAQIAVGLVLLIGGLVAGFGVTFWITLGMSLGAAALIGNGISELRRERRLEGRSGERELPPNKERELLSALRSNGRGMVPAEVAMETSLTVAEADEMLSDLASKGHLLVESGDGALFYRLPARSRERELEG